MERPRATFWPEPSERHFQYFWLGFSADLIIRRFRYPWEAQEWILRGHRRPTVFTI